MILRSGKYENVRVALVSKRAATEPREIVDGRWMESSPAHAARFSATAYCFAVAMNEILGIPVGVIACSWGGSHIAGWMPGELLRELGYEDVAAEAARREARPTAVRR